jgi:hypothetical protein
MRKSLTASDRPNQDGNNHVPDGRLQQEVTLQTCALAVTIAQ